MGLRFEKNLRFIALAVSLLWVVAQIVVLIVYWGAPQYSDAANYLAFAREAVAHNSWYPTAEMFRHNMWIANTGYVNLLVANLKLFGTTLFVGPEQLIFNILLLVSFRKIVEELGGKVLANVCVILFCLLPSNVMIVVGWMSDVPCVSLMMCSFALVRNDIRYLVIAGMLGAIANWMRPIGMIYWPSLVLMAIVKKAPLKSYVAYAGGAAVVIAAIMCLTYRTCGYPLAGSTTKGTNMMMGCWDGAKGNYDIAVFKEGNPGYISPECEYNAVQNDSCLSARSTEWILSNPGKTISLIPNKMFYLWGHDCYYGSVLSDNPDKRLSTEATFSIVYYIVLVLSLIGLWHQRRQLWGCAGIVLLPVLLGCGMHVLMYGGARYHYPLMLPVIYFAGVGALFILSLKRH